MTNDIHPGARQLAFHAVVVLALGMISGYLWGIPWLIRMPR